MHNSHPLYDVLVIGAGPVGLATAIGLQQRGINNILVIDQTREFRPDGSSWDDNPENNKYFFCRGGAWDSPAFDCRSSRRIEVDKDFVSSNLCFRVVYAI